MRARIWLGGTALATVAMIGLFALSGAAPAPAAKPDSKSPLDDRDEIANKLMERVTIDKPIVNVQLKDVLEFLSDNHNLTLLVDGKTFKTDGGAAAVALNGPDDDAILNRQISVPVMKKVRLATVLKHVADEIEGVYLLYPDHIKFVGAGRAQTLIRPNLKHYGVADDVNDPPAEALDKIICSIPLVNVNFIERPLQEALREVEIRSNRSIALSSLVGEKGKTLITTRFTNVPVDTAVATLAEMAGLKMASKGNVLLVTTSERAKEFDPPPPLLPQGLGFPGFPNLPSQTDQQAEELKKKVAELEKTIAELKKDKK
jgi:hypothetical protein